MKIVELYYKGTIDTFQNLAKGKFLGYFIPAVIVGLLLGYYYYQTEALRNGVDDANSLPLIGSATSWIMGQFMALLDGIVDYLFEFIVLVCFSPFNSMLAEKYDNQITGNKFDGGFIRIINDVLRAIFIIVVALFLELLFMGVWYVLTKIFPVPMLATEAVNFIIGAFFFGFSLFDIALERYGVGTFASWGYGFKRFLAMIIAGSLFI